MSPDNQNQEQINQQILNKIKAAAKNAANRKSQPTEIKLSLTMENQPNAAGQKSPKQKFDLRDGLNIAKQALDAANSAKKVEGKKRQTRQPETKEKLESPEEEQKAAEKLTKTKRGQGETANPEEIYGPGSENMAEELGADKDAGEGGEESDTPSQDETEQKQPEEQSKPDAEDNQEKEAEAGEKKSEEPTEPDNPAPGPETDKNEKNDEKQTNEQKKSEQPDQIKPDDEQKKAEELAATKNQEKKSEKENKNEDEEKDDKKEKGKKPGMIGLAQVSAQQSTGRLLQLAWLNVVDSLGLTLIYVNLHFILYLSGGKGWFAKPGTEWTAIPGAEAAKGATGSKGAGVKRTEGGEDSGNELKNTAGFLLFYAELIVLLAADLFLFFIIIIIITAITYGGSAVVSGAIQVMQTMGVSVP